MTITEEEKVKRIKLSYTGKTGTKIHAESGCSTKLGNHYVGNVFHTKEEFKKLNKNDLCEKCVGKKTFEQIAQIWGVWYEQPAAKPWERPTWKRKMV